MPIALFTLFAAAFAIGSSEFVIAGILPAVAGDLRISIPTAGLLVSVYALGVAVGGPLLATFTGGLPRKRLMLVYVAIFTIGYVLCALAPSFGMLLVFRVLIALIHGAYFGTAMVVATSIVAQNRRGFAVGLILSGLTVANIIGVPIGTAIGTHLGWRATFWAVAGLGLLAFLALARFVPADGPHRDGGGDLLAEIKALARPAVYSSLAIILLQTLGQFALFTYISPLLTGVAGVSADTVPWLLLLIGVGSTIGVLLGGRLADWRLMATLTGILAAQVIVYLLMIPFGANPWAMAALVLLYGALAFAFGAPVQTRILASTHDAPLLASSLIPSAFNVSIAAGTWLGGVLIDRGFGYAVLPWVGVVGSAAAVAVSVAAWISDRRTAAMPVASN